MDLRFSNHEPCVLFYISTSLGLFLIFSFVFRGLRLLRLRICSICMEKTYVYRMFLITSCGHSYCFSCMSKHVQFKLHQGMLPECPHEQCRAELKLESCKEFLTPELLEVMRQRVKEASIPAADRIYCPYPKCSTLLSKTELGDVRCAGYSRKCPQCSGVFCINCKAPWHGNMRCSEFPEEKTLKSLATRNRWRQCPECNHMVSLASGCYHIHCRCGHEFCYSCGAEWKKKKATCKCLKWDEHNLIHAENRWWRARRRETRGVIAHCSGWLHHFGRVVKSCVQSCVHVQG